MERTTVADLILKYPDERGEDNALIFLDAKGTEKSSYSFNGLKSECLLAAAHTAASALKEEVVLLLIEDQAAFVFHFFGCIMAGCVPAPLSPVRGPKDSQGLERMLRILKNRQSACIITEAQQALIITPALVKEGLTDVRLLTVERLKNNKDAGITLPQLDPADIAYLQYTSGSTSGPKGVVLRHQNVMNNVAKMARVFNYTEPSRLAGWIPFHHDMGLVGHLFSILYHSGQGIFIPSSAFIASPQVWLDVISRYRANIAAAPAFAFGLCERRAMVHEQLDLSCWKYAYVGAETVALPVLESFYQKFKAAGFNRNAYKPVYGLAEATLLVAGGKHGLDEISKDIIMAETGKRGQRALIPYLIDNEDEISIVDTASLLACAPGESGEIVIKSASNADGYLGYSNEKNRDGLLYTGDTGFIIKKNLYITGRTRDIVIVRGVNYAAEDLEACVQYQVSGLRSGDQTICVSETVDTGERFLVFQEVQRHMSQKQLEQIAIEISAGLSESYGIVPDEILLVASGLVPRTRNYKISRIECLDRYRAGKLPVQYAHGKAPKTQTADIGPDPIVIVGMACRFPGGADTPEKFWELLESGADAIIPVPPERWDNDLFYDERPATPGKLSTQWAGFIDGIDQFDPSLFDISAYEAPEIDPQQRLLLETSWRLLENTGVKKAELEGSDTGVFIGMSTNDYLYTKIKLSNGMDGFNAYSGLGNSNSVAANRLSYFYDFKGPSLSVDTACSSSLTAFHLAAEAIRSGNCRQAIAGGVNAILSPGPTITLSQFGMMAPDGRCKTFDQSADGYVRAEGCGMVMMKRRSDAEKDGNTILAVLCASTIAQDGRSPGITFPNGKAQHRLIAATLNSAQLQGADIGYVEAHGTGTSSGDPVEMEQIARLYGGGSNLPCYVGSVKASIGHLEAAAGIASVIKAVLMLQKERIPPQLHLTSLNPGIRIEGTRLKITTVAQDWANGPKRVAVSSFGFGGSLAHAILEKPVMEKPRPQYSPFGFAQRSFVFSAATAAALAVQANTLLKWLPQNDGMTIDDISYTQATCRSDLKYRKALMVNSVGMLSDELEKFVSSGGHPHIAPDRPAGVCYLFTGQGEHYIYMGKMLYQRFPVFKAAFDRCAASVADQTRDVSLQDMAFSIKDTYFMQDKYMQPVLFAIQYALGLLWQACGIYPEYMIGHSIGEYAAACLAGCFEPETGMAILMKRAALVEGLEQKGMMVTLFTGHEDIRTVMDGSRMQIAAINSDKKTVISGERPALLDVMGHFEGIEYYHLKTSHAFHSQLMEPIAAEFGDFIKQFEFSKSRKKWISALLGREMTDKPDARYWVDHLLGTVNFKAAVEQLPQDKPFHFIEIGPGASTLVAVTENRAVSDVLMLRSLNFRKLERTEDYFFFNSLGRLYEAGIDIKWDAVLNGHAMPQLFPGQTFMQQRYWMEGFSAQSLSELAGQEYKATAKRVSSVPVEEAAIYDLKWKNTGAVPVPVETEIANANWIVVGEAGQATEQLKGLVKEYGGTVYWLNTQAANAGKKTKADFNIAFDDDNERWEIIIDKIVYHKSREDAHNWRLIYLAPFAVSSGMVHDTAALEQQVSAGAGMLIPLLQALKKNALVLPVWIITTQAQVTGQELAPLEINLPHAAVWGFGKTLFLEHPEFRGGLIDVDMDTNMADVLGKIGHPENERAIAMRKGNQHIEFIGPRKQADNIAPLSFRSDGAFIVTGGLGGLGLKSAEWVVGKGGRHLILIGRREFPSPDEWVGLSKTHPHHHTVAQLLNLQQQGVEINVISMDVSDTAAVSSLFDRLDARGVPVRGIIHAAGVNWFGKVMDLDRKQFEDTLKIKISASVMLHQLSLGRDLDCFILFSSVSALWGSVELGHYTAANHFMDMLSIYRQQVGLPSLSINWGPWAEVGMSADDRERTVLQKLGFSLMGPATALEAMQKQLNAGAALSLIANVDWKRFERFIDFSLQPSLFSQVRPKALVTTPSGNGIAHILNSTPAGARQLVEDAVRMKLRNIMLLETSEKIDQEQRFNFLGMDSLMAISFAVELEHYFGIKLPNTLAYNYPTIKSVSDFIFGEVYTGAPEDEAAQDRGAALQPPAEKVPVEPVLTLFKSINNPSATVKCTIFCFPYLGAGASVYEKWAANFNDDLHLVAVQPPGREELSEVAPFASMPDLLEGLDAEFIEPDGKFVFFGHSFGGLIAYEFYNTLKQRGRKTPAKLFLSGCEAPLSASESRLHELSGPDFVDEIIEKYNNNKHTDERKHALFLNAAPLRADVQVLELYQPAKLPVQVPLVVIAGLQDEIAPPAAVKSWLQLAEDDFSIFHINSGHEMIREKGAELAGIISRNLNADY